jgi:hypothetical protein
MYSEHSKTGHSNPRTIQTWKSNGLYKMAVKNESTSILLLVRSSNHISKTECNTYGPVEIWISLVFKDIHCTANDRKLEDPVFKWSFSVSGFQMVRFSDAQFYKICPIFEYYKAGPFYNHK